MMPASLQGAFWITLLVCGASAQLGHHPPNKTTTAACSNPASTSSSGIATITTRAHPCANVRGECYDCGVLASGIGLNSWWTQHYTQTVATVAHHFFHFNNTVVTATPQTCNVPDANKVLGSYDADEPPTAIPGLPTGLIPGATEASAYGYSVITEATDSSIGGRHATVLQSPTPWTQGIGRLTAVATRYSDGTMISSRNYTDFSTPKWVASDYTFILTATEAAPTYSGSILKAMPQSMWQEIIANFHTLPGIDWPLASCVQFHSMGGEPTVHIARATLTHTASETFTLNGNFDSASPTPTRQLVCGAAPDAQGEHEGEHESESSNEPTSTGDNGSPSAASSTANAAPAIQIGVMMNGVFFGIAIGIAAWL